MKARLLLAIVFGLSQTLVLSGGVKAQGDHPPATTPGGPIMQHGPLSDQANQPKSSATVPLGQPGTSFRYVKTFGVTDQAYLADVQHLNRPFGLFVDGSDNLYVVEDAGRVLKYNSSGTNLLSIGAAGLEFRADYVFSWLHDAAVDGSGNIWVVDQNRAAEYSATGTHLQDFPSADPGAAGSDNGHFNNPIGIAFDSAGRMYVSDYYNDRIQVFSFSGTAPVYSTTIGVTGVTGTDNSHFNLPGHIALDGPDRLYVADNNNQRIQRCTFAAGWTCTTFSGVSGASGGDLTHLNNPWGVAFGPGNVTYIADSNNNRVLKCDSTPTCVVFAGVTGVMGADNAHFVYPIDVAVDSAGNVYVADIDNFRVQKFNSAGHYLSTIGVTGVPYVPDASRFYAPSGITVTGDGSLYFTEDRGHRALKLNAAGAEQWTYGVAGVYLASGQDNAHLGVWYGGVQGNPAVDAAGHLYIPDTGNNRIQILDSNGQYLATFGSPGQGDNQFSGPTSVFIRQSNGDIYVADQWNHRIQVFDNNRVHKATLGVPGVSGTDNQHFNAPWGVAVDANGTIYVADTGNHRVQKCALNGSGGTCTTFAGETGVQGDDFGHFKSPISVAVDRAGRVYVVDEWNQRVQVFSASGAYLSTIGGGYGTRSGEMRDPSGVALDAAGNVYVTDRQDQRIQEFAPGVPGWRQANLDGFGERGNIFITALEVFNGQLYAGAGNWRGVGGRLWRTADGYNWSPASAPGFGLTATNPAIIDLIVFNNQLYAGTGWDSAPGQIWRAADGTTWNPIVTDGFGDSSNQGITDFAVFSGTLYAAASGNAGGLQIWRSTTGDPLSWTNVVTGGNGDAHNNTVTGFGPFNGALYAVVTGSPSGVQVWRSPSGNPGSWSQVNTSGFGLADNQDASGPAAFDGYMYVGTRNYGTGGQLWRSSNGTTWNPVVTDGFGDTHNFKVESLLVFDNALFAATSNNGPGMEVWRSTDGTSWARLNPSGFGSSTNTGTLWSNATAVFNNSYYIGTNNWDEGGQIWQLQRDLYLPLVQR